ncbi:MAG: TolC family protein [Bacteroidales bacterium]|nr:TolC family protein [Bacteroidales bacterium]
MKKIVLLFICILSVNAGAQTLSLQQSIDMALRKNFDILVSRQQADINKLNNTKGNAGMLPTVNFNGTSNVSYNNVYQKMSTANTINKYPSQLSTDWGANAMLSWTLYDGGKMYVTKKKLAEMQALGELQYNAQVLEVIYNVVAAYFDIVRQKEILKSINEIINYNRQRTVIAQTGFNAGSLAKTELLQAKIDMNVAIENAVTQKYAIEEALKTLNALLGQDPTTNIEVTDSIPPSIVPDKNEMLLKIESSNTDLLTLKKQIDVAKLAVKEAEKSNAPKISLQGGYYLSQSTNSQGSTKNDRSYGMQVGGTLSIPLYTAGETKRKTAVAKTELLISQYNLESARLQISKDLQNAYNDFESQQQLLEIERQNDKLAKENMDISLQRLKLGQTTSLEVHQAQESYAQSSTRLTSFEYNLKMAETKLKQMISGL